MDKNMTIMNFVALDIERLNENQRSLCEIGMIKYENGISVGEFHSYVKPRVPLQRNDFALKHLSHITDSMLNDSDDFAIVYGKMKLFVDGLLIVCHNKGADLNTIYYKEKECGVDGLYTNYIDTMDIFENKKLKEIYEELFGKKMPDSHFALEDARHTAKIFAYAQEHMNISQYIKSDYIPEKEKPKSEKNYYSTVSIDGLTIEDELLDDFDFSDKICVISGESPYRSILKEKLPLYCKSVTDALSGRTNAFIVGDDNVGPCKKAKAEFHKKDRPNTFFIFTQTNVARKLGLVE